MAGCWHWWVVGVGTGLVSSGHWALAGGCWVALAGGQWVLGTVGVGWSGCWALWVLAGEWSGHWVGHWYGYGSEHWVEQWVSHWVAWALGRHWVGHWVGIMQA